ncbi:MAG: hypothetical protein FJZ96_07660 [Chloroflexi bacterium]|nr:hypothetical protein [Chloroflexota bacterium]
MSKWMGLFLALVLAACSSLPADPGPVTVTGASPIPQPAGLQAGDWKGWPVLPLVSDRAIEIYRQGLQMGADAYAFSIFGDCRSYPDTFLGLFVSDPDVIIGLHPDLQETVVNFAGSFDRYSPTVRGGTTPASLLWPEWHRGEYGCRADETPLDCELRIHNPSIVIVNLGLDWEPRGQEYMRTILEQLLAAGALPLLATKADNVEGDDHINLEIAQLAVEYDLPLWNFWAAVDGLPGRGLRFNPGHEEKGKIYLTAEAMDIYRDTGLQALDIVWRQVNRE